MHDSPAPRAHADRPAWGALAIAFAAIVLDGYDTIALGLSVPALSRDWGVEPSHFTPALSLTSAGVALGYLACGRLCARFGLRTVMLSAVVVFSVGSLATAFATSIGPLTVLRVLTGLGLGAVLPAAVAFATAANPPRRRQQIAAVVMMGLSLGTLIAGLVGVRLIRTFGWESVFVSGSIAAVAILPFLWFGVREPQAAPVAASADATHQAAVTRMFENGRRPRTLLLWTFAFLMFSVYYVFTSWLPTLLTGYGFRPDIAPLGSFALGVGSLVGGAVLILGASRMRMTSILAGTTVAAIVFLVVSSQLGPNLALLLFVFGGVGLGLQAAMIGSNSLAVSMYPTGTAATAVGWTASVGRLGSVVGPVIGGVLIAAGMSTSSIVIAACLPVAVALVVILVLGRVAPRSAVEATATPVPSATRNETVA